MECLIVEDEATTRMVYIKLMTSRGFSCLEVSTVEEALYYLKTHCFRVILLDLQLPGETSLAIADYVQVMGLDATLILITGTGIFPRGENYEMAPRIDYVLRKPLRSRDLGALIDYVLDRADLTGS